MVKKLNEQMDLFQEGGLEQDGGSIDPVSGNDVPMGSSQEEVRDDIPAQLSEGEFVFPADVVRFIGLEKLMMMRQRAKAGLKLMDEMGQMGNSEEATIPDDISFNIDDLETEDDVPNFQQGGMPTGGIYQSQVTPPTPITPTPTISNQPIAQPTPTVYTPPTAPTPPVLVPPSPLPSAEQFIPPMADDYVEYVNDAGEIINVPFFRGNILPGYTLPEGYRRMTDVDTLTPTTSPNIITDITDPNLQRDREREREEAEAQEKATERSYDNMFKLAYKQSPDKSLEGVTKFIKDGNVETEVFGFKFKMPGATFNEEGIAKAYGKSEEKRNELVDQANKAALEDDGEESDKPQTVIQTDKYEPLESDISNVGGKQPPTLVQTSTAEGDAGEAEARQAFLEAEARKEERKARQKAQEGTKEKQGIKGTVLREKDINRADPFERRTGIKRAKGGIATKPVKKKVMKRGGLASKK